jgi:hypothetical protein
MRSVGYPATPSEFPDGKTAGEQEMATSMETAREYNADVLRSRRLDKRAESSRGVAPEKIAEAVYSALGEPGRLVMSASLISP